MARKPKQPQDQPRSLSPEIAVQPELVRAGMYFTLQKLGDRERDQQARQLSLFEPDGQQQPEPADGQEIEIIGLHLSASEDRGSHALQVLLERTGYQGNLPAEQIQSSAWLWSGSLPRLATSYSDYLEAYGIQKAGDQYQGREREIALEALDSLQRPRTVYYKRKRWTGEGKARRLVFDVIKVSKPLISITKGWQGLSQEEASRVLTGQENLPGRTTRLVIEFSPLWVDGIENFFLLKPVKLHAEIQAILGARRISGAVSLFIEWLLTLNRTPWPIGKELLAEKLHLDYLIKQRHKAKLEKALTEAFDTAKEAGFLLAYREEPAGMMLFELNPERCHRLQPVSEPEEATA